MAEKLRIRSMRYRLAVEPTPEQRFALAEWDDLHGPSFGVSLRYERGKEYRSSWYGPVETPVHYLVIEIDLSRSGFERPPTGRPPKILPPSAVIRQLQNKGHSLATLAKTYGVSRSTLYRHLSRKYDRKGVDDTPGDVV